MQHSSALSALSVKYHVTYSWFGGEYLDKTALFTRGREDV